ncbi:MAG: ribosome assembly cofactor RimP [Bacteroidales bacterium]|nr:ribosome assembly cofactor RimP [Bacteroidales bacterium]
MLKKEQIKEIVEKFLIQRTDLFLVEIDVSSENDVYVYLDGDKGVAIEDCVSLSNYIRNHLLSEENFSLQVSSWGVESPLKLRRQFIKNIGQLVKVTMQDGTIYHGQLVNVKDEYFTIEITRGLKVKVSEKKDIAYDACKKVQVKLSIGKK